MALLASFSVKLVMLANKGGCSQSHTASVETGAILPLVLANDVIPISTLASVLFASALALLRVIWVSEITKNHQLIALL
jgi:hypothetical protein